MISSIAKTVLVTLFQHVVDPTYTAPWLYFEYDHVLQDGCLISYKLLQSIF